MDGQSNSWGPSQQHSQQHSQGYEEGEDQHAYEGTRGASQVPGPEGDEHDAVIGEEGAEGERGIIGDTYRKLRGKPQKPSGSDPGLGSFIFGKLQGAVQDISSEIGKRIDGKNTHSPVHAGALSDDGLHTSNSHRYGSFAAQRTGNDVKWFVDGCGYMWAVSKALEQATSSIWILDWWLSPELYLRRPPSKNEQYRLDRMLQAAAQRGVKVNIIVYKEVTQALTLNSEHTKRALEALDPNISVFRHPDHLPDAQTLQSSFWSSLKNTNLSAKTVSSLDESAIKALYGVKDDIVLFWAHHEKLCIIDGKTAFMGGLDLCYGRWDTNQHPIADCHPSNLDDIVFPGQDYNNARIMDFQDVSNWQNNKVDRRVSSRMGWSDISISLRGPVVADLRAHFEARWNFIYNEKYDVRKDARYRPITFTENAAGVGGHGPLPPPPPSSQYQPYSSNESGQSRPPAPGLPPALGSPPVPGPPPGQGHNQYPPPPPGPPSTGQGHNQYPPPPPGPPPTGQSYNQYPPPPPKSQGQVPYFSPPPPRSSRGVGDETEGQRQASAHPYMQHYEREAENLSEMVRGRFEQGKQYIQDQYLSGNDHHSMLGGLQDAGISCQIVRSCTVWSNGVKTEHSIANAYISVIENSQHFVCIENQFFITATSEAQHPVKNRIGAAIVDRILRAARAGQKYKIIVILPAVPGFAGDLKDDSALGTRAIMEFQYNSINRGGHSIMEMIDQAGFNPAEYIRFYNLRNYDRINVGAPMREAEQRSGVTYEAARTEHDEAVELPADLPEGQYTKPRSYQAYSEATDQMNKKQGLYTGDWDSVSECYMLGGRDIRGVPWETGNIPEIDAFVSEELYIHSKVLIADDRIAIVGSANLNDRSQLGNHDSEIAIIVEDPTSVDSYMDGRPYRASRFAATLRRQLFRKHLGLLKPQDMERPDQNFEPIGVPNVYDYGSPEDLAVMDPLADSFLALWNSRARTNTQVFSKVFHTVPDDSVLTWAQYDSFYEHFFKGADNEADGKDGKKRFNKTMWGHVVAQEFSPGEQGVKEVKDLLATVKGMLVEMPLLFLIKEDIAKEGFSLNAFTEEVYT